MKINDILEKTIPGLGYELVDVEITPQKTIRIFIDKDGGVSVDDCELVSNHLTKLFLVEEIDYNRLEISSPGVERPLKKLADFIKFQGKLAKIKLHEPYDGHKVIEGAILGIEDNKINIEAKELNKQIKIEFSNIKKARLTYDFRADLKRNKNFSKGS